MALKRFVVIFVSRRNTLRSILAQACLSHLGSDRFAAYSCGHPAHLGDSIDPAAISALASARMPVPTQLPRAWSELTRGGAPQASFVITLDAGMLSLQPSWPGQPDAALWDFPDVAAMSSPDESARAALLMLYALRRRLELMISLPLHGSDRDAIRSDVRDLAYMQ
ncbi:low molecular weight phosphatase family protein [Variovorax sp. YR216]|uniref:arsenate-mycothiol transferase ArsC n=1 Tax=Variovorax sp. YR216 TaxID=1882828 RepID=UPI00089855BF|nr:protein tyrosine phosphatase [Variovorax sp. YR216]SEB14056.1 Protein-tyrosine-phosphatase [Variovorax sp. YR216]